MAEKVDNKSKLNPENQVFYGFYVFQNSPDILLYKKEGRLPKIYKHLFGKGEKIKNK